MTARHVLERKLQKAHGHLIHPDFRLGTYVQAGPRLSLELVISTKSF